MYRDVPPPPPPPGANRDVPPPPPPGANPILTRAAAVEQDDGGVQMVRIEQPERVYNREAVLGRDAESVFPSLAQASADKVVSATQSVLGSMNFVTETELEEIKAKRGGQLRPEDGTMEVEKSLWAVLQEEAKEAEFAEGWKTMKQGKNKPLDEEEVEFLDDVEVQKRENEKRQREREKDDIECFKLLRETMVVKAAPLRTAFGAELGVGAGVGSKRGAEGDAVGSAGTKKSKPTMMVKPKFVPKFKAVPKKAPAAAAPAADQKKKEEEEEEDDDEGEGLGGLLGYGSGSEDD